MASLIDVNRFALFGISVPNPTAVRFIVLHGAITGPAVCVPHSVIWQDAMQVQAIAVVPSGIAVGAGVLLDEVEVAGLEFVVKFARIF